PAFLKYELPAQIGGLHYSTHGFSQIGRDGVTIMQLILPDHELAIRVKYDQVGVVSLCNLTLSRKEPRQFGWALCHPTHNIPERKSSPARAGPHHGKRDGKARDTAPCGPEASVLELLKGRRTGRV